MTNYCSLFAAGAPAPSRLTYGRVRRDSVTLEWEEPTTPVAPPSSLTGYLIEKREARKELWTPVKRVSPKVKSYAVPGLLTGREYMFRVTPIGPQGGLGESIMPERPITVASQYSKRHLCLFFLMSFHFLR